MVYVIAELRNYKQLARLRAASLPGIESGLAAVLGSRASPVSAAGAGAWMAELCREDELDPRAASAAAGNVRQYLAERRAELFGFAVLVASLPEAPAGGRAERIRGLLDEAQADDQLWLAPECAPRFAGELSCVREGSLYRATGQSPDAAPAHAAPAHAAGAPPAEGAARPWRREPLVDRALDLLAPRLNEGESRELLLVHGPTGVGKTALIEEVADRLTRGTGAPAMLRTRTVFKRRSPLHPFLSSLLPDLLAAAPDHLRGPERAAWDEVGGVLAWLRGLPWRPEQRQPEEQRLDAFPLPDHLLEDFTLGYRLYLLAWIRMAAGRLAPALFACEGVEAYHPVARSIVARLFDDLLACPGFIPVLSSVESRAPDEFAGFPVRPLYVHPLGKREIRSLAQHLFPGLEMPEALVRRLRRRSAGLFVHVASYLEYLARTGHIRTDGDRHAWVQSADSETAIPANPLSVSWYLIRTLHDDVFLLLYALYLSGGLLERAELLMFLAEAGFDAAAAERSLGGLLASGLVCESDALIPRFPGLRRKLEELLGAEGAALRDRFIAHLMSLWHAGRYRHPVLLYTFLARSGRTDLAVAVLPAIVRRKLDENDAAGARAFCDPRLIDLGKARSPEQARELAVMTAAGRLRAALLLDDAAAAESAQAAAARAVTALPAQAPLRGEVCIERAKWLLSCGSAAPALEELKRGLILFQEARGEGPGAPVASRGERACYLWLGATMLADGRIRDAAEYLGLSQRLCHEAHDLPGALWTDVYMAACLFVEGRFTQAIAAADRGSLLARAVFRREVELFLLFLKSRAMFAVGAYEEASLLLQGCLTVATLYGAAAALPVLRAWLGRTAVHQGDHESGTRMLESLPPTLEVLYFLAEASLFAGNLEAASRCLDQGLALPAGSRFALPEGIPWTDGYAGVEGRCFRLSRADAFVRRSLSGLRAYLLGMRGLRTEGIRELHQLTRGEKLPDGDPSAAWLNFLYARILPEAGAEEVDDRLTVLSKSLKSLQERASRIDAPAQRSSYLWQARWNRMIMEEARERKLL